MGEIGVRYPPSAQADQSAHRYQLGLLAADLADVDPALLAAAIRQHSQQSPYTPKASELIALAKQASERRAKGNPADVQRLHDYAAELNRQPFVKAYGWEYFVSQTQDGKATLAKRETRQAV